MTEPTNNNMIFDAYAAYYDLLYQDKDYAAEADYIHGLILKHAPDAKNVLELGCGSGRHAECLSKYGFQITGVDRSAEMIKLAQTRLGSEPHSATRFVTADIRDFRSDTTFDVVLALFHVISYQISNSDIKAALATASSQLREGGIFIFDCWYGPGVLTTPPSIRVRRMHDTDITVTRIAEPTQLINENRVDVNYEVIIENHGRIERIRECHSMRYFFAPEMDLLFQQLGLRHLNLLGWLSDKSPETTTWNACFIATK